MAFSYVERSGDGSTTTFTFAFTGQDEGYISKDDIQVEVDGVETPFVLASSNILEITPAPTSGSNNILIRRVMPKDRTYADFRTGNNFGQETLNNSFLQTLYTVQEILDGWLPEGFEFHRPVVFNTNLNMKGNDITNAGDIVADDVHLNSSDTSVGDIVTEAYDWAQYPHNQTVPEGNGVDEYSAYHYAVEAESYMDSAALSDSKAEAKASEAIQAASSSSSSAAASRGFRDEAEQQAVRAEDAADSANSAVYDGIRQGKKGSAPSEDAVYQRFAGLSTEFASAAQGDKADTALQDASQFATKAQGIRADNALSDASRFATAAQGGKADTAVQPADLGTAASKDTSDFASKAQGVRADSALQDSDVGTAASKDTSFFATAAQGDKADSALQSADLGTAAFESKGSFATSAQGSKADSALQDASQFATAAQGTKADNALPASDLPNPSGNSGKFLKSNGSSLVYGDVQTDGLVIYEDQFSNLPSSADQGQVAVVQGTSFMYEGTSWVAKSIVNVMAFGAKGDGSNNDNAAFEAAANAFSEVYVPDGTYAITRSMPESYWHLSRGANIKGLSDTSDGVKDTSRLRGHILNHNAGGENVFRVGDPNPWMTKNIREATESLSMASFVTPTGSIAGLFASRSSDNPVANMNTIGVAAYGVNDNTVNPEPAWGTYVEAVRFDGASGTFGSEYDFINLGNTFDLEPHTPISQYSAIDAPTVNLWLSVGGGDTNTSAVAAESHDTSAAITLLPNNAKFNRGMVVRNDSVATGEVIAMPNEYTLTWYRDAGQLNSVISHTKISQLTKTDVNDSGVWELFRQRDTGNTRTGDKIHKISYQSAVSVDTPYEAVTQKVKQESNFSGGEARSSIRWEASNDAGGTTGFGINLTGQAQVSPTADGAIVLGAPNRRWGELHAANGAIITSDEREKEQIEELDDKELRVAKVLKKSIRKYKFRDSVSSKGDKARTHFGIIAQDVIKAFDTEGLSAYEYGILCYDEWDDTLNEDGEVETKAGNRYGVRYDELMAFIIGAL